MPDLSIQSFLPQAIHYLHQARPTGIPGWQPEDDFNVTALAQGEYNMNFLVTQDEVTWVLRVNSGSQIGLTNEEQIRYEYNTLALLEPTGVTPEPYFLDDSFEFLPFGVLGMAVPTR